jgi:nucleoside-diphosphate-sugar epimerase
MNSVVIIGGAGYLGLHLVSYLLENTELHIFIVTRNQSKQVLFLDKKRVTVVQNILSVEDGWPVINLSFPSYNNFSDIKSANSKFFHELDEYNSRSETPYLLHISTIVLSEIFGENVRESRKDLYLYAKSIQEMKIKSNLPEDSFCILRIGNIIGAGSPWLHKVFSKISNHEACVSAIHQGPSNATEIGFLCRAIALLLLQKETGVRSCAELNTVSWFTIIDNLTDTSLGEFAQSYDDNSMCRKSLLSYFVDNVQQLILVLNRSVEYGTLISRLITAPILRDIAQSQKTKIKFVEAPHAVRGAQKKEFEFFCRAPVVKSSFKRDYELSQLWENLRAEKTKMGF